MTCPPGWREIPDPQAEIRRLTRQREDPAHREWAIRHPDSQITVRIDGHAFPDRNSADTERASCDQDCDTCDGGAHTLTCRDRQPWRTP